MKKNRWIAVSLALLLLLPCGAYAAENGATLSLSVPETLPKAGEEFTVIVEITDNPGVSAVQFTLACDKTEVICTDAEVGEVLSGMLSAANPNAKDGAIIAAASVEPATENGMVGSFTFTAVQDLSDFSFTLEDVLLSGADGKDLAYTVTQNQKEMAAPTEKPERPKTEPQVQKPAAEEPTASTERTEVTEPAAPAEKQEAAEPTGGTMTSFPDVQGHWGESYIAEAVKRGLFRGYADGRFGPDDPVTRAQFVTVLWRISGSPNADGTTPFADIAAESAEFQTAITWAYRNGYVQGVSENAFDPNGILTRQAAMKILFGFSGGQSGTELMFTQIYDDHFTDSAEAADWGKLPLYWGVYHNIISGTSDTTLSPNGTATRAQLAKIMVGYLDKNNLT